MTEYTSPSGKYNLIVEQIETKPGCWNYTRGTVYRLPVCESLDSSTIDEVLIKVDRNYSSFPFLFIEDHPDGYDYLVCGSDYQGQTVINLNTLETRTHIPEEAKKGHGFCWAEYAYNRELNILIVDGCYWACPYEYKFYDFSEPLAGWPEIEDKDNYVDSQGKAPTVGTDGLITCYETRTIDDDSEDDQYKVVATKTYELKKDRTLSLVEEWVDEAEKVRREDFRIRQEAYEAALKEYKATDPLYLLTKEAINSKVFGEPVSWGESIGQCYDKWHPTDIFYDSSGRYDQRICFDLVRREKIEEPNKTTITLEFGRELAPVKLTIFRNGKESSVTWYEHSIEGMQQALELAKKEYNNG